MERNEILKKIIASPSGHVPLNEFNTITSNPEIYRETLKNELIYFLENKENINSDEYTLNFLLLLVGQTKCKNSFNVLCNVVQKLHPAELHNFMGDFLTYDFPSVLAATYNSTNDENFNTLCQIIVNPSLPYDVRSAAITTIKILSKENLISLEKVNEFVCGVLIILSSNPDMLLPDFIKAEGDNKKKTYPYHKMTLFLLELCLSIKLGNTMDTWKKLYDMNVLSNAIAKSFDHIIVLFLLQEKNKNPFADNSTIVISETLKKYGKYKKFFQDKENVQTPPVLVRKPVRKNKK